jgi:hypothetical protein
MGFGTAPSWMRAHVQNSAAAVNVAVVRIIEITALLSLTAPSCLSGDAAVKQLNRRAKSGTDLAVAERT